MRKQRPPRIVPAPHDPKNIPRTCWTCLHRGPCTADWTYCARTGKNERRKDMEPCEHYDLNAVWIMVDWCYI